MSGLGRIIAAIGVAHNENTLALASINFDFSLIRVDAPPEYQMLGANLSKKRRCEAETRTSHRTARKLGALFEGVLPRTPNLSRAFGRRVSEISQCQKHNPQANSEAGPFAAHVGVDGTAIWAAATSGPSAIPIVLLACMLARIWPSSEATSLWVEIVECRRREIEAQCTGDETCDYIPLQAAQQDITRAQLAEWDASTRAWLQTAGEVKKIQQTQLMLVVNNLQLPVSNNMTVYRSVIDSSTLALNAMEMVLKGEPHRVQSGALLLGLSTWHLYPDMVVHGTVTREIRQHDDLFPIGSLITLWLESDEGIDQGVFWSLPLAHLRYYGDPVRSFRCTGHDAARISVDQLVYVALGALLSTWVEDIQEMSIALQCFRKLSHCINQAATTNEQNAFSSSQIRTFLRGPGWLKVLMDAAVAFDGFTERNKELPAKLMALGHRRFNNFLAEPQYRLDPFFGLIAPKALFPLLKRDEDRIGILRRVAVNLGLKEEVIIRYRHSSFQTRTDVKKVDGKDQKYVYDVKVMTYEYASAFPLSTKSAKRARSGRKVERRRHKRWISMDLG